MCLYLVNIYSKLFKQIFIKNVIFFSVISLVLLTDFLRDIA